MSKNYAALADKVITALGGTGNVVAVTHCMTRLRFVLQDPHPGGQSNAQGHCRGTWGGQQ